MDRKYLLDVIQIKAESQFGCSMTREILLGAHPKRNPWYTHKKKYYLIFLAFAVG